MLPDTGIHSGIPEQEYHADPRSLSSTGARTLLREGPRAYRWSLEHHVHKDSFDLGSVVHALVLGVGEYAVLDFDSWRTKAAREAQEEARSEGRAPILRGDFERADAIRKAVYDHELAPQVLADGEPEVSMWATDPEAGILMRGRADYLRDGYLIDFKTTSKPAHPEAFAKSAWDYGYGMQLAWYLKILELNGREDYVPLWIVVNTQGPYDVYVHQPSDAFLERGFEDVERALRLYRDCLDTNEWPPLANPGEIHEINLPAWVK